MRKSAAVAVALALVVTPALAQTPSGTPEMKSTGPGKAETNRMSKLSGTITAVDLTARKVTLKGKSGQVETFNVSPEVKRLDEVMVGDTVTIWFEQGLALEFQPPGDKPVGPEVLTGAELAEKNETPGGAIATWMRATVKVTAVDLKTRMVVFQGPDGQYHRVKAEPKIKLENLKVGAKLIATYHETLAITLVRASSVPAKAAKPAQEAAPAKQ